MKVLFVSRVQYTNKIESIVRVALDTFADWFEIDPTVTVVWTVPVQAPDVELEAMRAELPERHRHRLTFAKVGPWGSPRRLGMVTTQEMLDTLSQAKTTLLYDVVLSNQPAQVPVQKAVLMNAYQAGRWNVSVPVVLWGMWTATLDQHRTVPALVQSEDDVVAELIGVTRADWTIWESEFLRQSTLRDAGAWLKPSKVRMMDDRATTIPTGVSTDQVRQPREKPTVFWASRWSPEKKPGETLGLLARAAAGLDVHAEVCTQSRLTNDERSEVSGWNVIEGCGRELFLEHAARADVSICNSVSESYGIAWLEMLASGCLVVFRSAWWNRSLLPDWYWLVGDSENDLVQLARLALKGGRLIDELRDRTMAWVREEHWAETSHRRMLGVLHDLHDGAVMADDGIGRGTIAELADRAAQAVLTEAGEVVGRDVWAKMSELSDGRVFGRERDVISRMYLRRCLQARGWSDVGVGSEPVFVPKKESR